MAAASDRADAQFDGCRKVLNSTKGSSPQERAFRQFRSRAAGCGRRMTRSPEEFVLGDRALRRGPGRGLNAIAEERNGCDGFTRALTQQHREPALGARKA